MYRYYSLFYKFSFIFSVVAYFSLGAYAVPKLEVDIYQGIAPISASLEESKYVWQYAKNKVRRELKVRLIARKWKPIPQKNHYFYMRNPIGVDDAVIFDVERYARSYKRPSFLLSAPAVDTANNVFVFGATTTYKCSEINYALSAAVVMNRPGFAGLKWSIEAVAHELGHMLGAEHTYFDNQSAMAENALNLLNEANQYELYFSKKSIREVKECVRRMKNG